MASGGPTPPLVGSLTVIATSPLARSWRTYSTPPSSLTLTKRTLTLPSSVTLLLDSETTHSESTGGSTSHSRPMILQIAVLTPSAIELLMPVAKSAAMIAATSSRTPMYSDAVWPR